MADLLIEALDALLLKEDLAIVRGLQEDYGATVRLEGNQILIVELPGTLSRARCTAAGAVLRGLQSVIEATFTDQPNGAVHIRMEFEILPGAATD